MMETLANRTSCYVIAPPDAEVSPLLEAFRSRGFEPFYISDFIRRGEPRLAQIRTAFRSVNFVVALLYAQRSVNNVLFEIGVAVGLNKPVYLFSNEKIDLPIDLESIQVEIVDLSNPYTVAEWVSDRFALKLAEPVAHVRSVARRAPESKSRRGDWDKLQDVIRDIRGIEHQLSGPQLEARLSDAITGAGLTVARASREKSDAAELPDLALWVDDIQKEIGNPIAIEIKRNLRPNSLRSVVEQLAENLTKFGASAGIVLHANHNLVLQNHLQQVSPPIYVFSISELLDLLSENRLGKVLKSTLRVQG